MKLVIGVTGPTGAGKSVASQTAKELGFQVIDCDSVAHSVLENDSECVQALTAAFGREILQDNKISRKKLAERAFAGNEATALLNKTALPFIVKAVKRLQSGDLILLDAPTLFESGMNSECDVTIGILSDSEGRRERIMSRDKIDSAAALSRMNAGKTNEFYMENCDYIVYNNGRQQDFCRLFKDLIENILEGRK